MRKRILFCVFGFIIMAFLPLAGLSRERAENIAGEIASVVQTEEEGEESSEADKEKHEIDKSEESGGDMDGNTFKILDTGSGAVAEVDDRSFCIGALAYEMPPYFNEEALKAQCIACYTHFCRLREKQKSSPDLELKGAYFKADLSQGREYMNDEILKQKWGDKYEEYRQKFENVADEVYGMVLTDGNGEFIDASYFAVSSGMTENARDIFGFESPYLRAVPSPWDLNASGYCSERTVSRKEFDEFLKKENGSYTAEKGIGEAKKTASGSVTSIVIGGVEYTGADIRRIFGLRSAVFRIEADGDDIKFTVRGYGHGVGMSQYGANSMAQQGADYRQIIKHYYSGAEISVLTG